MVSLKRLLLGFFNFIFMNTNNINKKPLLINLNERKFKALSNSSNGEVGSGTIFHYRQDTDIIWATYQGGSIKFGTLSGSIKDNKLQFHYQHQNMTGEFMTGKCQSIIKIKDDKIQLHETWQWTSGDFSKGNSILQEIM